MASVGYVSDFGAYVCAVARHWVALIIGGFLGGLSFLDTFYRPWGQSILPLVQDGYIYIFLAGVFWAGFLAWRDERRKAEQLQKVVPDLNDTKLAKVFRESIVVEQVETLYEGNRILLAYNPIPKTIKIIIGGHTDHLRNTPAYRLSGRSIIIENEPAGGIPYRDIIEEEVPKRNVIVEYQRNLTVAEIQEIAK